MIYSMIITILLLSFHNLQPSFGLGYHFCSKRSQSIFSSSSLLSYSMISRSICESTSQRMGRNYYMSSESSSMKPPSYRKPEDIVIPMDKISIQFARSSGPGGQNVNKLNTKAEARFHVDTAEWLPIEVRQRLKEYQENKVSKDGELIVSSQEHRTQKENKKDCISKLQEMIAEAYMEPKEREMWIGISEKGKAIRRDEKRKRSAVKEGRRMNKSRDYD